MSDNRNVSNTLVIGLDGATLDLISSFVAQGHLPTFKYMMHNGSWGELESTVPPITAAAWPSFMTGENPGKHGILKFLQPDIAGSENSQVNGIVTSQSFAGRTFFDFMGSYGYKVAAITIPVTYPPWDVNGVMISGYPCPDNNQIYTFSKDIKINVNEPLNFEADFYQLANEEQILADCLHRDRLRSQLALDLVKKQGVNCLIMVLGGIDRACHDYWKYYDNEFPGVDPSKRSTFQDAILKNYQLADEEIRKYLDLYGKTSNIYLISDHGSGRHPYNAFNVNRWLKSHNLFKVNEPRAFLREMLRKAYHTIRAQITPKDRKTTPILKKIRPGKQKARQIAGRITHLIDWSKTKAFHYPLGYPADGIMINLKGRMPNGIVSPGREYDELLDSIIDKLAKYKDRHTGKNVIRQVLRKEEIYKGPFVNQFPDLVYQLNAEYIGGTEIFGPVIRKVPSFFLLKLSGVHRMNGIFFAHGPDIKSVQIRGAKIVDVAPTILYSNGLPVPETMDGTILKEIFSKEIKPKKPDEKLKSLEGVKVTKRLNDKERQQIETKLKSLGYI